MLASPSEVEVGGSLLRQMRRMRTEPSDSSAAAAAADSRLRPVGEGAPAAEPSVGREDASPLPLPLAGAAWARSKAVAGPGPVSPSADDYYSEAVLHCRAGAATVESED
ncbi:MAG TPA: hypothetical protein VGF73_02875 [Chthoniobacterales bacterium]